MLGADKEKTKGEIEYVFSRSPDYRVVPSNGVWGGITPRGDLLIDFTVETGLNPKLVAHEVTEKGLGPEIRREPPTTGKVQREAQVGILISLVHAQSIAKWLLGKVEEFEKKAESLEEGEGSG